GPYAEHDRGSSKDQPHADRPAGNGRDGERHRLRVALHRLGAPDMADPGYRSEEVGEQDPPDQINDPRCRAHPVPPSLPGHWHERISAHRPNSHPPFTWCTSPVTNEASGEAR